jgi:hypothetical protein
MPGRSTTVQSFASFIFRLFGQRNAGEISDMVIGARQGVEQSRLAAVLVTDQRKYHFF